jgi:hypothetical protein
MSVNLSHLLFISLLLLLSRQIGFHAIKGLFVRVSVSVSVYPPLAFGRFNQYLWKLGSYIMANMFISTACCINPSHQPVCLTCSPITLLSNGLIQISRLQRIHMGQEKNCWTYRFLCGSCRNKGNWIIRRRAKFHLCLII